MGQNEYGKSGHLSIFTLLKHYYDAFEVRFSSHQIKDTGGTHM